MNKKKKEKKKKDDQNSQKKEQKKKAKNINNQIQEKELDEEFKVEEFQAERDIKQTKVEIQQRIKVNRNKLKKIIKKIKRDSELKKEAAAAKLKKLKSKIADAVMKATNKGNQDNCKQGLSDDDFRLNYCNNAFPDDYVENDNCKDKDSFCYSCCDNEFGTLKLNLRDDCLTACDDAADQAQEAIKQAQQAALDAAQAQSKWQWHVTH